MKILAGIPMPPSSNAQYAARTMYDRSTGKSFARICPTNEYDKYKDDFKAWTILNRFILAQVGKELREGMLKGFKPYPMVYACFNSREIYTLKGDPKMMDATNRVKALHDLLADILGIDDKEFFGSSVEKVDAGEKESFCAVWFEMIKPRTVEEISKELNEKIKLPSPK